MSRTVAQLKELKELLDDGVLTKEEFDAQKTFLLEKSAITMQPGMSQPGMMAQQRPPPFGCPPGGEFVMVKYKGPVTEQAQRSHTSTCCILGILFGAFFGAGAICCLLSACPPQDLKDEKEVYQVGGTFYTLNGVVDTSVGTAPMPPAPIDVDPATAARLAELINRSVGVWKSSPTASTNKILTLTQTFVLRPLNNSFYATVLSTTGKTCLGCEDGRLTSERHGKFAADGTSYSMQTRQGGLMHGALTSYDTDSNVATYSFNGPGGVSGTFMIDGYNDRMTSHSITKAEDGIAYEFKFEFRR
jgi:hypothetical protein